jgi:Cof subfamily protein (haloacid dehalogenase superfamily)
MTKASLSKDKISAIALDLDGTILLPNNTLSERTIRTLKKCKERGFKLILCTGRSPESSEPYRLALGADGPAVYFSGAEVLSQPNGLPFYPSLVKKDVVETCVDISHSMNVYFQVYLPETLANPHKVLLAESMSAEMEMYHKHTGTQAIVGDIKQALANSGVAGCIKGMFIAEPETLEAIRVILHDRFGSSIYVVSTLLTFLEILPSDVSKGNGLKVVTEQLGIKAENVIAFGDEDNDLPMFEAAGFSAAPANAKEHVRAAADVVIGANTEDGVAAFLEEMLL